MPFQPFGVVIDFSVLITSYSIFVSTIAVLRLYVKVSHPPAAPAENVLLHVVKCNLTADDRVAEFNNVS